METKTDPARVTAASTTTTTTITKPRRVLPYSTQNLTHDYTIGKKLGQGQFGTTYLCTQKSTGLNYACKTIPKRKLLCQEDYDDVWREIQIMHHLSEHQHVVRIHDTYEDKSCVHIVMELCEGGELRLISWKAYKLGYDLDQALVIAERLNEEEIGGLKELFKMIDTDNSGTITFDELKDGLKRVGSQLMESEIKDLMDAADIDNSGTIDYGEFLAATLHLNKLEREENLLSAFSFFDKDASGYITIDELQHACKEFGISELHLDDMIKEIDQDDRSKSSLASFGFGIVQHLKLERIYVVDLFFSSYYYFIMMKTVLQDGQIDYEEFAAMMRKGNGGIGRRTMRNTINLGDALGLTKNGSK
ncbi:hypothetical protein CUMW_038430 [Citrus unshiu]|nr:hypothetical protein CUMW_038430 [Citrus unshiu]